MENITIEHRGRTIVNLAIGCMWILFAVIYLVFDEDMLDKADWIKSILFFTLGSVIIVLTLLGLTRTVIRVSDDYLKIRLSDWMSYKKIRESEIERIVLAKGGIKIYRTGRKPVNIYTYDMGKEQKEKVFRYFTAYAKERQFTE